MSSSNGLGPELERIRNRLRAMRHEREAAMNQLAESRETAEAHRHDRADADAARGRPAPPDTPAAYAP